MGHYHHIFGGGLLCLVCGMPSDPHHPVWIALEEEEQRQAAAEAARQKAFWAERERTWREEERVREARRRQAPPPPPPPPRRAKTREQLAEEARDLFWAEKTRRLFEPPEDAPHRRRLWSYGTAAMPVLENDDEELHVRVGLDGHAHARRIEDESEQSWEWAMSLSETDPGF